MTTKWNYESDSSDEGIGLTNNVKITDKRRMEYAPQRESKFCIAMLFILILAIGIVTGLFVALSDDDQVSEQSPITTVSKGYADNQTSIIILPTIKATMKPTLTPTLIPTNSPSTTTTAKLAGIKPSSTPTLTPTIKPSLTPTLIPSNSPSTTTTAKAATVKPSLTPTQSIIDDQLKSKLQIEHNIDYIEYDLDLRDWDLKLGNGKLLTKVIVDNKYEIPNIYEHSHLWQIKYPSDKDVSGTYNDGEYRRWCFNWYLYQYTGKSAQIDISFKLFELERGFDRILIRHFNQSFSDPPLVISGRGQFNHNEYGFLIPKPLTYHIWNNEFKSICIELETDDTINYRGINFTVSVKYDDCVWSNPYDCYIGDQIHKNWTVKPYYDGKCGIGIYSRKRSSTVLMKKDQTPDDITPNGFVDCAQPSTYGPQYCLKSKCQDIITGDDDAYDDNPNFNSFGRIDPDQTHPDLLRIATAYSSTPLTFKSIDDVKSYMESSKFINYPFYDINNDDNKFDLNVILQRLQDAKDEITSIMDEKILKVALRKTNNESKEYLGARLAHSLLIGRVFTIIIVGGDDTAGHLYQFASSYPMQLQSILRVLWQDIGVDGAGFNVRNIAMAINERESKSEELLFAHIKGSETSNYPFNYLNQSIFESDTKNGFHHNEDMLLWEFLRDIEAPAQFIEIQLRMAALLNAIYAPLTLIKNNCEQQQGFKPIKWESLQNDTDETNSINDGGFFELFEMKNNKQSYRNSMGMMQFNMENCLDAIGICDNDLYQDLLFESHLNVKAHKFQAYIIAYNILDIVIDFFTKYKTEINDKSNTNMSQLNEWLMEKSGNWRKQYMMQQMETDQFEDSVNSPYLFPRHAIFCSPFCDQVIAPFALNSFEPNTWNIASRLKDYIYNDYLTNNKQFNITNMKSLELMGWSYKDLNKNPPHYLQDRLGDIGAMDKQMAFIPNRSFFQQKFTTFTKKNKKSKNSNDKQNFTKFIMDNNMVLKIGILVPKIGDGSIFIANGFNHADFLGNELNIYDLMLSPIDIETKENGKESDINYQRLLFPQRECSVFEGCIIKNIPSGKYILTIIPINIHQLEKDIDDSRLAITSILTF